jgi:chromosome segregation ATPase
VDEANERKGRVDACQRKVTEHERLRRELKIRAQTAESNVERLELELSAAAPDSGMLEQLEESLKEAQEERKFEEGQLDDILAQKDKLDLLSREQKDSTTAAKGVIEQLNVELDKLARNAEKLKHKREQALREKNSALESVEAAAQTKSRWEEQRRELMSRVQRDTSLAEQICARGEVPRGETLDSLDRKRARLARERVESERE